eukprot:6663241-Alexandrium_andersonii.AAC.1
MLGPTIGQCLPRPESDETSHGPCRAAPPREPCAQRVAAALYAPAAPCRCVSLRVAQRGVE